MDKADRPVMVYLYPEQDEWVEAAKRRLRKSKAQIVRELIDEKRLAEQLPNA